MSGRNWKYSDSVYHQVAEAIASGLSLKEVAFLFKMPLQSVSDIRKKFFNTILVMKENIPSPDQLKLPF